MEGLEFAHYSNVILERLYHLKKWWLDDGMLEFIRLIYSLTEKSRLSD